MEVGVRDLRNRTSQVVDAVKAGVPVPLTVHGEPVADIVPHRRRIRWLSGRICAMSSPSARPTRASPMNSTTWPVIPSTTCDRGRGRGRPARYVGLHCARERRCNRGPA
ncbi:type II toxin-antitoxin system Phd/YefM family antitoxin [Mycobacterium tuberculosis]|uniref:type II toxin-antitoxin system Phd/YefM family antitoxin n=1 Tax=Mycobacterium tuberculosis TaxID=1773 RepID=UPI00187B4F51|nr:type II toxin-antitoxin system Phd/YefM family antitoxin [Mycobacterium tuberculosis]